MTNNKNHIINKKDLLERSLYVFGASVVLLILIWVLEIILKKIPFSISSIFQIHKDISIWIVDTLPFLISVFYYITIKRDSDAKTKLYKEAELRNSLLNKYTEIAERLGSGDYETPIIDEEENNELVSSFKYLLGYLRATRRKENDQTWVSEGKELISRILRLYNNIEELSFNVLKSISDYINVEQGAFYVFNENTEILSCSSTYAYNRRKYINEEFKLGHGLVGQCAFEKDFIYRTEIPKDYISISSGILGDQKPSSILLVPLISNEKLMGVMEFATISEKIPKLSIQFLLELGEIIARTIYNLKLNQQTELLLFESRELTEELRKNEKILVENADIMEKTQLELKKSNEKLEAQVSEAENARGKLHWLLENASEVISIYNKDLQMTYVSPSVKKILGYSPEEMMLGKDFERLTRDGALAYKKLIEETIEKKYVSRTITYSYVSKEGDTIFLESSARNFLEDPSIKGIIINTSDITEKIRAEKEERLKTRMQSLSENSLDLIIRLSTNGRFHYLNPVVEDYIGISAENMVNKNLSEINFSELLKEYFENSLQEMKIKAQKTNSEINLPVRMGEKLTERIISFDAIPELTQNELETILFVGHDITEAKRIEKEIQIKNDKIEDSINYAEKIQKALLPEIGLIKENFPRSFVFYKPRDIISGDFPWFMPQNENLLIAAADCTGHGVPGALLSFIAFFLLKDVATQNPNSSAGEICDSLHENFRTTLKQNTAFSDTRDGLDIALCKINPEKMQLEFAGAHRPLLLLSDGELTEFKGNRKAIGGIELLKKTEEKFENYKINLKKGDKVFFFTDGLTDQLGGPYGRKYSPNRLRNNILENPGYTMQQYNELFESDFNMWQKGFKQLDDVLMIGLEF
ncbi:MAG: PAS domain S-box protein [Bacteroidales bacterium]|nr:PAS domain S-box protein [Bacteroidales bacterium]MCF8391481.1 PAS domain S-box protein [Bacteroidales bacterium]